MKTDINAVLTEYASRAEEALRPYFAHDGKIFECMGYSVFAGGKRIRPALMMLFCEAVGGDVKRVYPFAAALEMIHTYSLIHDDLPCMDDDDLRRGRPTNHKVYGEGLATLAGDGLLGYAFETALEGGIKAGNSAETTIEAARLLAHYSGVFGMLGGQVDDIEKTASTLEALADMYEKKTACLLMAAAEIGVLAGGGDKHLRSAAREYAKNIGIAFQIEDDILDVISNEGELGKNIGSDNASGKITFASICGAEGAKEKAGEYTKKAQTAALEFEKSECLQAFADYLLNRKK